jgi:hypothetical protein
MARVRKEFDDGFYNGIVMSYTNEGFYHVKYDDNDSEDMSEDEALYAVVGYQAYLRNREAIDAGSLHQTPVTAPVKSRRKTARRRRQTHVGNGSQNWVVHAIPLDDHQTIGSEGPRFQLLCGLTGNGEYNALCFFLDLLCLIFFVWVIFKIWNLLTHN